MSMHRRVWFAAALIATITIAAAVVVLGVGWHHTDTEIRKDQRSWCGLLGDIRALPNSQPISPYGQRINAAARDQYRKFGCRG